MRTWLITGGAGFIGSNFVRMAAARGAARLVVLDALTYAGNYANIADMIDGDTAEFVHGSINDADLLAGLFDRHDIVRVVHFAAESHVDRSIIGPRAFIETNVMGTAALLEAARAAWQGDGDRLFLHVSTDEVYGDLGPGDPPFTEASSYRPSSPYSASKAGSDHLVRSWHRTYRFPAVVTSCSNNYGPWQFPEKLIPLMILNAAEGRELPVYGDGRQIRDWLHVEDHCEALLAVLERGRAGETYAIGGGNEQANIDIVHRICQAVDDHLGRAAGTAAALIRHVTDRPGHDRRYAIDAAKAHRELDWRPRKAFDTALSELVAWYLEHTDWVSQIRSGEYLHYYDTQYGERLGQ